jgi:hypothetical protein
MRLNVASMSNAEILATLQDDLQTALQLEQATLPPYLCAYWSISPKATSAGAKAAGRHLLTVIHEEMIHLAVACNILNATGGQPSLNGSNPQHPVPTYPGPLPGHSKTSNPFIVGLGPLGPSSLQIFLDIELPRYDDPVAPPNGWATIGEFYDEIIALCKELADTDFQRTTNGQASDASNPVLDQSGYYQGPGSGTIYRVKSVAGAIAGMNEIIIQGEGVKSYHRDALNELAHYYQFQQVLESIQPGGAWTDYQNDVFPMAPNPASLISQFPPNAISLNTQFNGLFSQLLDQLHAAFNSVTPDTGIQNAITTMLELQAPAQALMQIALSEGPGNCGPTFEYTPASNSTKT